MNLLLAAVLLTQDKTAEEAFNRIEEQIVKAKTLSVKCRFVIDTQRADTAERLEGPAVLLLKEGNKISYTVKQPLGGSDKTLVIISDGSKATWNSGSKWESVVECPENFETKLRVLLARAGVVSTPTQASAPWLFIVQLKNDFKKLCQVSNFKQGPDDGDAKTLTYSLVDFDFREMSNTKNPPARTVEIKLWYDPKTYKAIKRVMTFKNAEGEGTLTETYLEFLVNPDMPDEKFKLPEKEK